MNKVISDHALLKRLNRKHRPFCESVRKMRTSGRDWRPDPYVVWDWSHNIPTSNWLTIHDLEDMAREMGCLAENEEVTDAEVSA